MSLRNPQLWLVLVSVAAVLVLGLVDVRRESPGPLATVHGREDELSTRDGCARCHGGLWTSMTDGCLDCHAEIAEQIERAEGLHGVQGADRASRCALCHSEHNGPGFPLVNPQSFVLAGASDPDAFDHGLVGFPMEGRHLELACADCHANAHVEVLPRDEARYLGLDQDCSTCHEDAHDGRMAVGCARCHGQESFDRLASPGHVPPLVGGHGDLECAECHQDRSPRSLDALGERGPHPAPRRCTDCHESPHARFFVDRIARFAATTPEESCVLCHEAGHESFTDDDLEITPEQHARSGFPLLPPHDGVACRDCHAGRDFVTRYPGRRLDECESCHGDPHDGQFDGIRTEQGCLACHDRRHFVPSTVTVEQHARGGFPLTGAHVETACSECHRIASEGAARTFVGTASRCEACHADAHGGFFRWRMSGREPIAAGECARCHLTTDFAEIPDGGFDHFDWTGFAVLGAHAESECTICHVPADEPDENGRTFGSIKERFGAYRGCATCHVDPHGGAFADDEHPRWIEGRTGCARCHAQSSFRTFPHGFDHGAWTGFAIEGVHAEIGCSACHVPLAEPDGVGRTSGRAAGSDCASCHANPHAGQFEVAGRTDCRRCHTTSTSFSDLSFDHEVDSRFPLGEAHENVACGACHEALELGGRSVVRYRPIPRRCVDCHAAQVQPALRLEERER